MNTIEAAIHNRKVVSANEWLAARKALLEKEKQFTRQRDELARERQELPWVRVDKNYRFDGRAGKETLADLFDGRSQLFVYHFMFGPEWTEGCPGCSLVCDHLNPTRVHLAQRDVTLLAVSRAPLPKINAFKERMGWSFNWVSSGGNDFNRDYGVLFTKDEISKGKFYNYGTGDYPSEEAHGASVFYKDPGGDIFHTYSTYARGCEDLLAVYAVLDKVPKGRDEEALTPPMAWVRHHDRYANGSTAGANRLSSTKTRTGSSCDCAEGQS